MRNIYIGLVLIFIDLTIYFDSMIADILPDFLGYIMIYYGLKALDGKTPHFMKIKPFCNLMFAYEAIIWAIDVLGFRYSGAIIITELISMIGLIYITYHLNEGIGDIQRNSSVMLNYEKLCKYWYSCVTLHAVLAMLSYIFVNIAVVMLIIFIISSILYLYQFYKTQKIYYMNI